MSENKKLKGPWVQRLGIIFLSLILGVLWFWLLGFLTKDIGSLRGPDFSKVQADYIDAEFVRKQNSLKENLDVIKNNIRNKREQQVILKDSTNSLQNTINQLLSIQKQNIERNLTLSDEQQQALVESQALFLENQKQYLALNTEIAGLTSQQHQFERELASVSGQINKQRTSARNEYNKLMSKHRLKVAALKLAVIVPIFLISAWFFIKKRSGMFGPIIYTTFIAVFIRISLVVYEYFPRRYFKYIALLVIIAVVLRLLLYLLKRIAAPQKDWILKHHQETYDKGICPICGKPIRIGPLRYAIGHKRRGLVLAGQGGQACKQELYTCPSCGTELYEKCAKCGDIRHSLLPFCEHCGNEKTQG
jgi:predicted RNA-binding Zn-ribbon protein involved in translation (DUF1610 family)